MSIKTVEKFLNIPIDYYMEGFEDILDALDGVTVYNTVALRLEMNISKQVS